MARFTFRGICYETMQLRDVLKPGIKIGAGSFNQDAQGPWSIRMPIEVECATEAPISRVDVDPAPLSDERQIEIPRSSPQERGDTSSSSLASSRRRNLPRPARQRVFSMPHGRASRHAAMTRGGMCLKVNETYTSQVCSCCAWCQRVGRKVSQDSETGLGNRTRKQDVESVERCITAT
jgi:hypothetical protein